MADITKMKNVKMGAYAHNDELYNFNFATDLTAHDKVLFVRTVVDMLVDDDNYDSIIRDMIFDFAIVMLFTDIDTSFIKITDDDGEEASILIPIEQFLEETNVVDIVKANMKVGLLEELEKAVDKLIEYRTDIHPSPIGDAIASLVSTLENKIREVNLDDMMGIAQKFVGMTDKLTPESLVNAYLDSDVHNQNLAEIAEAKKDKAKIAEDLDSAIKSVTKEDKVKVKSNSKK